MRRWTNAGILAGVGASLGHLAANWIVPLPHKALAVVNTLDAASRSACFLLVMIAAAAGAALALLLDRSFRSAPDSLDRKIRALRPLSLVWLVPLLLDGSLWMQRPLFFLLVAVVAIGLAGVWLDEAGFLPRGGVDLSPRSAWGVLVAAMAGYAAYVAFYTIRNHCLLGTSAYDLGIMENVIWNTVHGRWFASSIEGGSHLGVHTSFIYLLLAPIYAVAPKPETLLVVQALVMALAAWPLYLVARELTGNRAIAAGAAVLYLLHPAVQGANFYDFHELAFAPALFFAAVYFLIRNSPALWPAAVLLLSVKEDQSLAILLLGMFALMTGRKKAGWTLAAMGVVAYVVCQRIIIPAYSVRPYDFAVYYADMTPPGEGPLGVVRTLVVNPLFALGHALTADKLLYLAQILAPLAFLSLFGAPGLILMAYGLFATLLSSREPVYVLGFQYALLLVPQAFVAALTVAATLPAVLKRRAVAMALATSFLVAWHHGMLFPREHFAGGPYRISFAYGDRARARNAEIEEIASHIKPELSVTASETLVPHVARRERIQSLRFADAGPARSYDILFVLREEVDATKARLPEVFDGSAYAPVYEGTYAVVYAKRPRRG